MNMRVVAEDYRLGDALSPQRARGELKLALVNDGGAGTRLADLYQAGCLKIRFPRAQDVGTFEAVTLNLSGGIAGGDHLDTHIHLGANAQALIAALAAEKVYGARVGESARVETHIHLEAGASLDYLPQETILFDNLWLERNLTVTMAADARYLGVECLVFGRAAMGEVLRHGELRDRIRITRAGQLLFLDQTRLSGDLAAQLSGKALAGGAGAFANIVCVAPDAGDQLNAIREAIRHGGGEGAASAFSGMVLARLLAKNAASLREGVVKILEICRKGRALPRVWQS
ncbi:MAG: urease accessory protein UreD [Hyphomicrobiales bacterium]|nr:urease accessory protein UreD [Hyphomicrobiales bacterium]MDE2114656.1 urease accessory protein UreD [Hyphomicrobiales bacterium]